MTILRCWLFRLSFASRKQLLSKWSSNYLRELLNRFPSARRSIQSECEFAPRIALLWLLLRNNSAPNCLHRPRAEVKVRWTTGANCWIAMSLIHNCSGVVIRCFKHVEHFADWLTGAAGPVFVVFCWLLIGSGGVLFCKFHSSVYMRLS